MSPRRSAQLGLLAVCLLLVTSLGVLVAGPRDRATGVIPTVSPAFATTDLQGKPFESKALRGKVTVLYFFSVRCPVCNEYTSRLSDLVRQYSGDKRVQFVGVHSTAADKAVNASEVRVQSAVSGMKFPMLDDREGAVARKFKVARTPTIVVLDEAGFIRYQGPIDDNRNATAVKTTLARHALDAVLGGKVVAQPAANEIGCAIFKN